MTANIVFYITLSKIKVTVQPYVFRRRTSILWIIVAAYCIKYFSEKKNEGEEECVIPPPIFFIIYIIIYPFGLLMLLLTARFNTGRISIANMLPIEAVTNCGIENVADIALACGSGSFNSIGTAILTILRYNIINFEMEAITAAIIYTVIGLAAFRFPMKCQTSIRTIFPAMIKGIKDHNGPMLNNFAKIGESTATVNPVARPQVITEIISIRLTMEPVIKELPKAEVTACMTMSNAVRTAVLVIHKILLFINNMLLHCFL